MTTGDPYGGDAVAYGGAPVVTGEAVALELRTAGVGSRLVALIIDIAVQFVLLLIPMFFVVAATSDDAGATALFLVLYVLVVLGYPVIYETFWRGRTLGKAAMGLRVVRDDGGPVRFRHALVRGLAGMFLEKPGITLGFAAFICMMTTQRSKRVGDILAGTVVLQDRVPGQIDVMVAMPPPLAGWAGMLDLSGIDDGLALRLRQFVGRASQLSADSRARIEGQLAGEVVAKVGQPPQGTPAWAVLSAVLAERRRRSAPAPSWAPTMSQVAVSQWTSAMPAPPPPVGVVPPPARSSAAQPETVQTEPEPPPPPPPPSTTGYAPPG